MLVINRSASCYILLLKLTYGPSRRYIALSIVGCVYSTSRISSRKQRRVSCGEYAILLGAADIDCIGGEEAGIAIRFLFYGVEVRGGFSPYVIVIKSCQRRLTNRKFTSSKSIRLRRIELVLLYTMFLVRAVCAAYR